MSAIGASETLQGLFPIRNCTKCTSYSCSASGILLTSLRLLGIITGGGLFKCCATLFSDLSLCCPRSRGAGLLLLKTPCSECETMYAACETAAYMDDAQCRQNANTQKAQCDLLAWTEWQHCRNNCPPNNAGMCLQQCDYGYNQALSNCQRAYTDQIAACDNILQARLPACDQARSGCYASCQP